MKEGRKEGRKEERRKEGSKKEGRNEGRKLNPAPSTYRFYQPHYPTRVPIGWMQGEYAR